MTRVPFICSQNRYQPQLLGKRVICLDIPDNYKFMDAALVKLLKAKLERHLPFNPSNING